MTEPRYRAEEWPDDKTVERRGRVPDDLLNANTELAMTELWHRLRNKKRLDEMSTATLAAIVKVLAGLQLGKEKLEKPQAVDRGQVVNVLALVQGLNDPQRQLKVLKAALPGAEQPEVIEAAIVELEGTVNGTDVT